MLARIIRLLRPSAVSRVGAGGILLCLAACAGRPSPITIETPLAAPASVAIVDPAFAASVKVLDRIELADSPADWQIGDRVLLGIRTHRRGETLVRLLLVELTGMEDSGHGIAFTASPKGRPPYKFSSPTAITRLTLFDDRGRILTTASGRFATELLGCGLYQGVDAAAANPAWKSQNHDLIGDVTDEEYRATLRGWMTLFSFSASLGKKGLFKDMLNELVSRPTWVRMLLNPTISLGFADGWPHACEPWSPAASSGAPARQYETIRVPLVCVIAGKEGARADVLTTRPVAPLSLCGGVLAIDAHNADRPEIRTEVRLLGAARGSGGQRFVPSSSRSIEPE